MWKHLVHQIVFQRVSLQKLCALPSFSTLDAVVMVKHDALYV